MGPPTTRRTVSRCNCQAIMVAFKGIWTKDFWRAVSGEFLATLIFVLVGLGSTINWGAAGSGAGGTDPSPPPPANLLLISLCFGLTIATMVQCFGHISGGHINPAVTAAMLVTRKISLAKALFYVLAQCLGAVVGAGILFLVTPADIRGDLGVNTVNPKLSVGHGLVVELIITFQLVFTIFATGDTKRNDLGGSASLMNPARSLGPALVTLNFRDLWVYWVGPVLGAVLAAGTYEYLYCPDPAAKRCRLLDVPPCTPGTYREVALAAVAAPVGGGYVNDDDDDEAPRFTSKPGSAEQRSESDEEMKKEKQQAFAELPGEALSS
ncbi:hypothetical protein CRUP_033662, partial [Coryphaenoides rupestris]